MNQHVNKLVDDVTKKNTELISRLLKNEKIDSAWFSMDLYIGKPLKGDATASTYSLTLKE